MMDIKDRISALQKGLEEADAARVELEQWENRTAATIAKYARADGIELDPEGIKASITRPYTLIPDPHNPNKALLIHWRGIKMPIFGWVKKQDPVFTIAEVTRGMDMLTPFPEWLRKEMGWKAPEHAAVLDGSKTSISLQSGDPETFKKKYGRFLSGGAGGKYKIKGAGWIKLVAALIQDGILPFQAEKVTRQYWNPHAISPVKLKDYQVPIVDEFLHKGAVFINLPPGGGKNFTTYHILGHFDGAVAIFAPSTLLVQQWKDRLKDFAPELAAKVFTYAGGKKALGQEWDLVIFDEVQTLPADTFSKLAFIKTKYRIGLSATPYREDGRQFMITALSGFPCRIPWADLIQAGVLQRPRVIVVTVPTDAARSRYVENLISKRRGRALVFCDYLKQGKALAELLDIPFISGETRNKLEKLQEGDAHVVSRVADRGLDLPDLTLVVEVAFLGKSREQEAQRLGRLLHGQKKGEHYIIFTAAEAPKLRGRIYGIEAELAGAVDIEYLDLTGSSKEVSSPKHKQVPDRKPKLDENTPAGKMISASPALSRLLMDQEKRLGTHSKGHVYKAFSILVSLSGTSEDLRLRSGLSKRNWKRYRAGLNLLVEAGIAKLEENIYSLDKARIKALL